MVASHASLRKDYEVSTDRCVKNDEFCIENERFCIQNEEFCITYDGLLKAGLAGCGSHVTGWRVWSAAGE